MACNAQLNTIDSLRNEGLINQAMNIEDLTKFEKVNDYISTQAEVLYGVEGMAFTIQENKRKALGGHSYHRDNMITTYRAVPNVEFFEQVNEKMNSQEPLDYWEDDLFPASQEDGIQPRFERYIIYKQSLISKLKQRLSIIEAEEKRNSDDAQYLKNLARLKQDIKNRLEGNEPLGIVGLEQEVADLVSNPQTDRFEFYAEKDLERLEILAQSDKPEDIDEAKQIIYFYETLGTFSTDEIHPLYNEVKEVEDRGEIKHIFYNTALDKDGETIIPEEVVNLFSEYKSRAIKAKNTIHHKKKQFLEDIFNSDKRVINTFGDEKKFTFEEITSMSEGLKDTSWMDMFIMDVTNGIFSDNGVLPQVMMGLLKDSFEKHLVRAKQMQVRIDNMQEALSKVLSDPNIVGEDYSINIPGIKNGVTYDLFRAKDELGNFKDEIINRYDSTFFSEKDKMLESLGRAKAAAAKIENPKERATAFAEAYAARDRWYRKNAIVLDVTKIPEVFQAFPEYAEEGSADQAYKEKLIETLGEKGYQEEVQKQIQLIKNYQAGLEAVKEKVLAKDGKSSVDELTTTEQGQIDFWVKENNPFITARAYETQERVVRKSYIVNSDMEYNVAVPRKNQVKMELGANGKLVPTATGQQTGYYNERFKIIENNETLSEFHAILKEFTDMVYESMPPDKRKQMSPFSIPAHRKNVVEILFDKDLPFFQRILAAAREFYDRFRQMFGENQESFSQAHINPVTGRPEYQVNSAFLKTNGGRINERFNVEMLRFKKAMGINLTENIKQFDKYDITNNPEAIAIVAEALDTDATLAAIQRRLPNADLRGLEIGKVLKSGITDQTVKENSLDLPRIMKMYSFLTMEYAARQAVLPAMKMLKDHYNAIKNPNTNREGGILPNGETPLNNLRNNANRQMESWFNRAVLGNYNSKNELGNTRLKKAITFALTPDEEKDNLLNKVKTTITGRILSSDEKLMDKKLNEVERELISIKDSAEDEDTKSKAANLLSNISRSKKNLGKTMSFKAFADAIFNFIRFRGLGWNLSAYTTNFLEGQTANMIQSASGEYFTPENIYRANDIVKGSWLKNMTAGKYVTPGAELTRVLMDRYRILQDASNELQKATTKTSFSRLKNLDPHEGTRRIEYLNQAPLMIAMLMDETIYSTVTPNSKFTFKADIQDSYELIKSGEKKSITRNLQKVDLKVGDVVKIQSGKDETYVRITSVEDLNSVPYDRWAQESTYDDVALYEKLKNKDVYTHYGIEVVKIEGEQSSVWDAMNPDGSLKEEFRSLENIKNWENADGEGYQLFKSKIAKMIVNTHGDYEDLRGIMGTEYMTGKALIMFKRWFARQLYQRFAYRNKRKGQTDIEAGIKDYYGRYYSHTQSSGMLHGAMLGFAGLSLVGAGPIGLLIGGAAGLVGANFMGANSNMHMLQELAFTTKELFTSMLRLPVNTITGKNTIKTADYDKLGLSERDTKNLRSNLTEMSLLLSVVALTLFAKALLYDSDDEEDSTRRQAHNLVVNRLMQLSSQASMYLNPVTIYENFTNMGLMLFLNDVIKVGKEANDMMNGEDVLTTGPHAGESAFYNQLKKTLMPGVLKGGLGFENAMQRQFQATPYDSWFKSTEDKAKSSTTQMRAAYRAELEANGLTKEEAAKQAREKFRYKKPDESYEDLLEEYEESN